MGGFFVVTFLQQQRGMTMLKLLAPILGVFVLLAALDTMPAVWAQTAVNLPVHPPVEIPATLTMIPYLGDLLLQIQKWIPVVFQVVGAFSMIAAMTANETDDKVVNYILKAINFLGFNFGTATNDPSVGVSKAASEQ
jgi:hypothetical protein